MLLADEPTGDLDEQTAGALHDLLQEMHRAYGLTSVIATHNPRLASGLRPGAASRRRPPDRCRLELPRCGCRARRFPAVCLVMVTPLHRFSRAGHVVVNRAVQLWLAMRAKLKPVFRAEPVRDRTPASYEQGGNPKSFQSLILDGKLGSAGPMPYTVGITSVTPILSAFT